MLLFALIRDCSRKVRLLRSAGIWRNDQTRSSAVVTASCATLLLHGKTRKSHHISRVF
jgi:hypothetical protein